MEVRLKNIIGAFRDILFALPAPSFCLVCGRAPADSQHNIICRSCMDSIPYAPAPEELSERLRTAFPGDSLSISRSAGLINIRSNPEWMLPIYYLKYYQMPKAGFMLGRELGRILQSYDMDSYDIIIPVPIHRARLRERGYNQSMSIAGGLGKELSIAYSDKLLKRKFYTPSQTRLSSSKRLQNVHNAFRANSALVQGRKILLVDDVMTTGATLNNCATALLESGAVSVDTATIGVA